METYNLSNGTVLNILPINNAYSISIGLYVLGGPLYENMLNNGATHLLEHIHFRSYGFNNRTNILYQEFDCMGSTLRGTTYKNFMTLSFKIRPSFIYNGINALKKLISTDTWDISSFTSEKSVVLNQILERQSYFLIENALNDLIWKGSAMVKPIMGTKKTVSRLQLTDIECFKQRLFSKNNMSIVMTGALTNNDIKCAIDALSSIQIHSSDIRHKSPSFAIHNISITHNSWNICEVGIAFKYDYKNATRHNAQLLQSIIGGGCSSELYSLLVDEKQLAVDVYSDIEFYKSNGIIKIFFSAERHKLLEVFKEIAETLADIKKRITELQLKRNKVFFTDNLNYWYEDPTEINFQIGFNSFVNEVDNFSLLSELEQFEQVNTYSLGEAARNIFKKDNMYTAVAGDVDITECQIEKIFDVL